MVRSRVVRVFHCPCGVRRLDVRQEKNLLENLMNWAKVNKIILHEEFRSHLSRNIDTEQFFHYLLENTQCILNQEKPCCLCLAWYVGSENRAFVIEFVEFIRDLQCILRDLVDIQRF